MFKFFKEMKNAFKEGIAEGKEELRQEELQKHAEQNTEQLLLNAISDNEQFGTAIAAPFRVIVFGDWFSLFSSNDDDGLYPIHLYTFGDYPQLEKHKNEFAKLLKRDFEITHLQSCLEVLASYFDIAGIDKNNTHIENVTSDVVDVSDWSVAKDGVKATISVVAAYIITSATDVGYMQKSEAMSLLDKVSQYVKLHYANWEQLCNDFLVGETNVRLNNSIGKSVLKKYTGYLKSKKGSPWNNITW